MKIQNNKNLKKSHPLIDSKRSMMIASRNSCLRIPKNKKQRSPRDYNKSTNSKKKERLKDLNRSK